MDRKGRVAFAHSVDPVAVTYAIRPDLCPATPVRLEVDDKVSQGRLPELQTPVCLHSDEKEFLELLVNRITAETMP